MAKARKESFYKELENVYKSTFEINFLILTAVLWRFPVLWRYLTFSIQLFSLPRYLSFYSLMPFIYLLLLFKFSPRFHGDKRARGLTHSTQCTKIVKFFSFWASWCDNIVNLHWANNFFWKCLNFPQRKMRSIIRCNPLTFG